MIGTGKDWITNTRIMSTGGGSKCEQVVFPLLIKSQHVWMFIWLRGYLVHPQLCTKMCFHRLAIMPETFSTQDLIIWGKASNSRNPVLNCIFPWEKQHIRPLLSLPPPQNHYHFWISWLVNYRARHGRNESADRSVLMAIKVGSRTVLSSGNAIRVI